MGLDMTNNTENNTMTLDETMAELKEYEKRIKTERKWVDTRLHTPLG